MSYRSFLNRVYGEPVHLNPGAEQRYRDKQRVSEPLVKPVNLEPWEERSPARVSPTRGQLAPVRAAEPRPARAKSRGRGQGSVLKYPHGFEENRPVGSKLLFPRSSIQYLEDRYFGPGRRRRAR